VVVGRSAVAGVALAAVTAAAAVGGLGAGLRRGLELGSSCLLRGDTQDDGGLRRGALLLQVGVLLAAGSQRTDPKLTNKLIILVVEKFNNYSSAGQVQMYVFHVCCEETYSSYKRTANELYTF
jgi:hypothetical protein